MRRSFQEIAKQAPVGLCILMGEEFIIEMANDAYLEILEKTEEETLHKPLFEVTPEIREIMEPVLINVFRTGETFTATNFKASLVRSGKSETAYFNLIYQPLRNDDAQIIGIVAIASEVTELEVARQELQKRELNFRQIVLRSPIAMAILRGPQLNIELANELMLNRFWRRTAEEVTGKELLEVFPELNGQDFPEMIRKVYATGEVFRAKEAEVFIDAQDGRQIFYIDFEYSPLQENKDSAVTGVIVSAYDVTETVEARRKATQAEERLTLAIESTGMGNYEVDMETNEMVFSRSFLSIFGFSPDQEIKRNEIVAKIHPDDLEIRRKAHERSLKTGVLNYEFRVQRKENEWRWIKAWGRVLFTKEGKAFKLIGTVLDQTEEKLTMLALKSSEQRFRTLADTLPAMVWISDPQGNIYYFNRSVYEYSGFSPEQLASSGWLDIVHPDDREENLETWFKCIETGTPFLFEHRFRRHDGLYRWQLSRAVPQYNEAGQIEMWVGSSTDIHDHKVFADELEEQVIQRTKELVNSNEALLKSNTELAQFAYVASHDLQEPLRKIQTFVTMVTELEKSRISEKGSEILQRLRSTAERMQQLVVDLLSYSRVNKMENHFSKTDLNYLISSILLQMEDNLENRGIRVSIDQLPDVWAVPFQMEQLFTNLLSNAIKFSDTTKQPIIQIRYEQLPEGEHQDEEMNPGWAYHKIEVEDNGIGFDEEYKDRIFQVFQRLHAKESFPGTGIGLAICKKIIDNHQGKITASGEIGKGAKFTIYLPDFSSSASST